MAQWIGQFSGRTHESRVADAEVTLRHAIDSLSASGPETIAHARKSVLNLAEKLLSARMRQRKARLSQQRERLGAPNEPDAQVLASMERSIAETHRAGVAAILKEFNVREVEAVLGSRPNKSLERTRER